MKGFPEHFNVHTSLKIVFLNNCENFRSPFNNETLRQERSRDRLKILESCKEHNMDNQVNAVVGAHMQENRNKWQTTAGQYQLGYTVFSASTI